MDQNRDVIISSLAFASVRKDLNPNFKHGKAIVHRDLATDPDTGMVVQHTIYERGICPPKHRHTCGHGMYVLSGTLYTDSGIYGPGCFLWWPAGTWMVHGATDRENVEVLFITNGPFDLEFEDPSFLPEG